MDPFFSSVLFPSLFSFPHPSSHHHIINCSSSSYTGVPLSHSLAAAVEKRPPDRERRGRSPCCVSPAAAPARKKIETKKRVVVVAGDQPGRDRMKREMEEGESGVRGN